MNESSGTQQQHFTILNKRDNYVMSLEYTRTAYKSPDYDDWQFQNLSPFPHKIRKKSINKQLLTKKQQSRDSE